MATLADKFMWEFEANDEIEFLEKSVQETGHKYKLVTISDIVDLLISPETGNKVIITPHYDLDENGDIDVNNDPDRWLSISIRNKPRNSGKYILFAGIDGGKYAYDFVGHHHIKSSFYYETLSCVADIFRSCYFPLRPFALRLAEENDEVLGCP